MRPTVPELLDGVARALEGDVAPRVDDPHARRQVLAAVGVLRRLAAVVPRLTPHLLADAHDIAETLHTVVATGDAGFAELCAGLDAARDALTAFDPAQHSLDDLQTVHQHLLKLLDRAVLLAAACSSATATLDLLLERCVVRERDLGASIAGR